MSMLQIWPPLNGIECSGDSENYQSSQLAELADEAKLTIPAKVEFPKIRKIIHVLILVGGYDCAFICVHVSSFSLSIFK